jgi:hypothetical protein
VTSPKQSGISPTNSSPLFLAAAARFGGRRRLNESGYQLFWETMAVVASMLIFSALRTLPTEVTGGGMAQSIKIQTVSIHGNSKELHRGTGLQQAEARGAQLHMARDFTNHSNLPAHTTEKSEVVSNAQARVIPTRVVLD